MARYVAFLRAVNLGRRKVAMERARQTLTGLGLEDVSSYVNSGNLLFTATGKAVEHETSIRAALEDEFGFEITTFVRTATQVRALADSELFEPLAPGHTHFALLPLAPLSTAQQRAVEGLTNEHDEVVVVGRDVHWLIRSASTETTLGPQRWKKVLPGIPTTARNMTMVRKLALRL